MQSLLNLSAKTTTKATGDLAEQQALDAMLRQDTTSSKGAYLSAARTLGAAEAVAKVHDRAERQIKMHRKGK